jgi:hypothetical protein
MSRIDAQLASIRITGTKWVAVAALFLLKQMLRASKRPSSLTGKWGKSNYYGLFQVNVMYGLDTRGGLP